MMPKEVWPVVLAGLVGCLLSPGLCAAAGPALSMTSPAFAEGGAIPQRYTCDGANVSPALAWGSVPAEAKSLALICDDPDAPAGTWVHWVLFNIPAQAKNLPEAVPAVDEALPGKNDFGRPGYGGPCPPGGTHRYYFRLYALDCLLNLKAGATKVQVLKAMEGHVLAEGQLMGIYKR